MKGILKLTMAMLALTLMVACSDDEPAEKDPVVGEWVIDSYIFANLPDGYQQLWEGYDFTSLYGETKYMLSFDAGTFTRSLTFNLIVGGDTTLSETGEWESDGEFITLDPTGAGLEGDLGVALDNNFEIAVSSGTDLVLNAEIAEFLYADTTTQTYYDYVWSLADSTSANYDTVLFETEVNRLYKQVIFDLQYDFDLVR